MNNIEKQSQKVFESWFQHFAKSEELINKERLFEFFHSGYLAGTRFDSDSINNPGKNTNIIHDDINRNLDL